ncbi:integrase [Synergistales bacterium]|nr:integrase [Synergistales bacterium]
MGKLKDTVYYAVYAAYLYTVFIGEAESVALTELMVRQAKPEEKTYLLSDGCGLSLEVRPNGSRFWVIRYWVGGKERRKSIGRYPDVGLKAARDANHEFKAALKTGKPTTGETLSTVAEEWMSKRMSTKAASYLRILRLRLDRILLPELGHMRVDEITSGHILQLCRRIEERGTIETANRVKMMAGQIFNYAIATGRAEVNPTAALHGALAAREARHYASITEPDKVGLLMRQIEAYPYEVMRYALKFSALTFCRPGEIRHAEWKEIDFEKAEWRLPGEKMKMKRPHAVPLARQTIELLDALKGITGNQNWLFPSSRRDGRCMSDNGIRTALRSMGYTNDDMTAHGFRAMASTILYEHEWPGDVIEIQLAHQESNKVKAAYNHAQHMEKRREMMQWWADYLSK